MASGCFSVPGQGRKDEISHTYLRKMRILSDFGLSRGMLRANMDKV